MTQLRTFIFLLLITGLAFNICSFAQVKKPGKQTLFKDADLYQSPFVPAIAKGNSRYYIAPNLALDFKGNYPEGNKPLWTYVGDNFGYTLKVGLENYMNPQPAFNTDTKSFALRKYNNKAIIVFGRSYGELEIKDGLALLTKEKQTFRVSNFKKIKEDFTDESSAGGNNYLIAGGLSGEITLSADEDGNIAMDLIIEIYNTATRFREAGVSYRLSARNVNIENRLTIPRLMEIKRSDAAFAAQLKAEEEERKKQFELRIKNSYADVIRKQNSYTGSIAENCLQKGEETITTTGYSIEKREIATPDETLGGFEYYTSEKRVPFTQQQVNRGLKNTCTKKIVIYGVRKEISELGTIYYTDESIQLDPGEMAVDIFEVENNYDAKKAFVGSTHYFKTKLKSL